MLEKPKKGLQWAENPSAPHVVFDMIVSSTFINGAFQITLAAQSLVRETDGTLKMAATPTAHLRMTPAAAGDLARAIKDCFEMTTPPDQPVSDRKIN